jgi:molybdenum cofactor guanylyltransferase
MNFTTIILAGGRSSRMGCNKAVLPYCGKPLIQYPIELASKFSGDILISANNSDLDYLGFQTVKDLLPVQAPLAGIHAGLNSSLTDWNLVLSCDMPNINKELISRLLASLNEDHLLVLPGHGGFVEPLCGFYHKKMISRIESNFNAGKISLLDLALTAPYRYMELDDLSPGDIDFLFKNVNERKDLSC